MDYVDDRGISVDEEKRIRARLRAETDSIKNTDETFGQVLENIKDLCREHFRKAKKLKAKDLKDLLDNIDKSVRQGMSPLKFRYDERKPTMARPKSEAFESMYVVLNSQRADSSGAEFVFRLHSLRVLATRKKVVVETVPMPLALRYHAAERLYERGEKEDGAITAIARNILDWSLIPAIVEECLFESGGQRICVPGPEDGSLVMGYIDRSCAVPIGTVHVFDLFGIICTETPASPMEPGIYYGNTFLSAQSLSIRKAELHDCFTNWRQAVGDDYLTVLEDTIWPNRELNPPAGTEIPECLTTALSDFVSNERVLAAMGNQMPGGEADYFHMSAETYDSEEADIVANGEDAFDERSFSPY